jgi:Protein of unknown function (DUF3000).
MAAAQGRLSDGAGGMDDAKEKKEEDRNAAETAPGPFRAAVEALRAARLRPDIEIDPTRPPQRLAPYRTRWRPRSSPTTRTWPTAASCCCTTRPGTTRGRAPSVW